MAPEEGEKKPEAFPPTVEEDEQDEEEPERLPVTPEVEREAQQAIREIEEEEAPRPPRPPPPPAHPEAPGFIDRAWDAQYKIEARLKRIGRGRYSRVLKMARKPEHEEFVRASQITSLGIAVIGFFGFLILLLMGWLMGLLGVR